MTTEYSHSRFYSRTGNRVLGFPHRDVIPEQCAVRLQNVSDAHGLGSEWGQ